jgi:hypothetical protein
MRHTRILWLFYGALTLFALALAFQGWRSAQAATVVIEWETASEIDTAGFNLYRGSSPDGSFVRVNENIIPASPDPLTGGTYSYEDKQVQPGRTYYYELESIDVDGSTSRYGPTEVTASRNGQFEIILSVGLALVGLVGLVWIRSKKSEPAAHE